MKRAIAFLGKSIFLFLIWNNTANNTLYAQDLCSRNLIWHLFISIPRPLGQLKAICALALLTEGNG